MGGGWGTSNNRFVQCGWCHSSDTFHLHCMEAITGEECSCIRVDLSCCQNGGTDPAPWCDPSLQYLQGIAGHAWISFLDAGNAYTNSDLVCVYYDGHGLFQEVDGCCCQSANPNNCGHVCQPTPVSNPGGFWWSYANKWVVEWHPRSSDLPLGGCAGDCD